MKTSERQHLKTNEVAEAVLRLRTRLEAAGPRLGRLLLVVTGLIVVLLAVLGWRSYARAQADELLAQALAVETAPVVPAPLPGTEAPPPPPRSFSTEGARREALMASLQAVVDRYPSTPAGRTARFRLATMLADQGKLTEAEREFAAVAGQSDRDLYGLMARLALADLKVRQGNYEAGVEGLRDILASKDDRLPVDGLLMELGRAQALAGQRQDALQTFSRVADEFPQSPFVAEARREAERLRLGGT